MRALVTGATGFIGRHLVLELRRRDWDVICMVRHSVEPKHEGIRCIPGDLLHPASLSLDAIDETIDVLFHFAAQLPGKDVSPEQYQTANCESTKRLLESAARLQIRSIVYASSLPVIGAPRELPITENHPIAPTNPYHRSKLCAENACETERRDKHRCVTSLRITSPYGSGMAQTVLSRFADRALRSEPVQWMASGSRAQNFVHVSDVADAALLAAETNAPNIYNIGGPETTTMRDLAELTVRLAGSGTASSAAGTDPEEGIRWEIDLTRASAGLGYRPKVSLEGGLREYLDWKRSGTIAPCWWKV
jgi:nucleoside-diphosphate-sugar epimerase